MDSAVQFPDGFDRPDTIAFGLPAPQLAVVALGGLSTYALLASPLPAPLRIPPALLVAAATAVLGWGRLLDRPMLTWAWLAVRYVASPRSGGSVAAAAGGAPADGSDSAGDRSLPAADANAAAEAGAAEAGAAQATVAESPAAAALCSAAGEPRAADAGGQRGSEPAWARWLVQGGAPDPVGAPGPDDGGATAEKRPSAPVARAEKAGMPWPWPWEEPTADGVAVEAEGAADQGATPIQPAAEPAAAAGRTLAAPIAVADIAEPATADGATSHRTSSAAVVDEPCALTMAPWTEGEALPTEGRTRRGRHGLRPHAGRNEPAPATNDMQAPLGAHPVRYADASTVEISRRVPLVLLPLPLEEAPDMTGSADASQSGEDGATEPPANAPFTEEDDADPPLTVIPLRVSGDETPLLAVAETPPGASAVRPAGHDPAPVFVGAPRRITFFSLNGGSGRTTLATELACTLAARGRFRASPDGDEQPLRVALLDLDLRSATVAVRLGIPQPSLWDYLLSPDADPTQIGRYMVRHDSGVRALLGPPKPLVSSNVPLEPARVAEIVHQLEREGFQFVVMDIGADLGAVSTWVLSAAHDVFVVITPTASGMQDAYRSTETLRRLGVGHKLRYVVNRARGGVDLDEIMGDLGGRIVASIPDDPRVDEAENTHRVLAGGGSGPAADALTGLAATVYPALTSVQPRRRMGLFGRRHAG